MLEITYQVAWPNGVVEVKTIVVKGKMLMAKFLKNLNLYNFVIHKTIGFKIISIERTI